MDDCPVCATYWPARQVEIDKAGDRHHRTMADLRRAEAVGVNLERIQDVPAIFQRLAEETVL